MYKYIRIIKPINKCSILNNCSTKIQHITAVNSFMSWDIKDDSLETTNAVSKLSR